MFTHLSPLSGYVIPVPFANFIVPLILWQMKKNEWAYVDDQGKEALNFQISILLYAIGAGLLCLVVIGFVLLPAVVIFGLVYTIIAAVKANEGEDFRYPLSIRLIS